jgi:hypothetical protein
MQKKIERKKPLAFGSFPCKNNTQTKRKKKTELTDENVQHKNNSKEEEHNHHQMERNPIRVE